MIRCDGFYVRECLEFLDKKNTPNFAITSKLLDEFSVVSGYRSEFHRCIDKSYFRYLCNLIFNKEYIVYNVFNDDDFKSFNNFYDAYRYFLDLDEPCCLSIVDDDRNLEHCLYYRGCDLCMYNGKHVFEKADVSCLFPLF